MYLMPLILLGIDINLYVLDKWSTVYNNIFLLFILILFHIASVISFIQAYRMKVTLLPSIKKDIIPSIGIWIGYKNNELMIALPFIVCTIEYPKEK